MNEILEGLQILSKYSNDGEFSAGHDQIWAGGDDQECVADMNDEDLKRMGELNWFIDSEFNCWSHFA